MTGLFAGELADRLDRRRLMGCDLSRCALYAPIPLAWALASTIGVPPVLALRGLGGRAVAALGLLTPVRLRRPEELKPAA